ncbi:hypothetical protein HDU80_002288 [Chytriomyces hyalinus]|nr:hypothetical protein HDU80_002288 [Chytriomyces hyalinus]
MAPSKRAQSQGGPFKIRAQLDEITQQNPEMSLAVAAVKVLASTVRNQHASTMTELTLRVTEASNELKKSAPKNYSILAGCEAFLKQLNHTDYHGVSVEECKERILEFEENFVTNASGYVEKISTVGANLIKDGSVILMHSYSRVVMALLQHAAQQNKRYSVIATESRPSRFGEKAVEFLSKLNVPVKLVPDSAVGFVMEKVDLVLVGAEAVVENGGLINQMGTYQIALVAKAANKPFYAVTESYKFVRMFPLSQSDVELPEHRIDAGIPSTASNYSFVSEHHVDYTPPHLVSSLITNLGVLTPSGVVHILVFARSMTTAANPVKIPVVLHGIDGRYATALYSAAAKKNVLEAVESELNKIGGLIEKDVRVQTFMETPIIDRAAKKAGVASILSSGRYSELTSNFFQVLAENGRLDQTRKVVSSFQQLMTAHRGEVQVTVTSAKELETRVFRQLQDILKKSTLIEKNQKIVLSNKVDATIVGGLIIEAGGKTIDLSVSSKVAKLERLLKEAI